MRNTRTLLKIVGLTLSVAALPGAPARAAQSGPDPDCVLLANYVQSMVASMPNQALPEYGPAASALLDRICLNLDSVAGLTPGTWCAVGSDGRMYCNGLSVPNAHGTGGPWVCFASAWPNEVRTLVQQAVTAQQSPGTVALYVVFWRPLVGTVAPCAFPLSQIAPYIERQGYCVAAPNSVGPGALLYASGSPIIGANDLVLQAAPVPNATGSFFVGTGRIGQQPFGDGFLCTGGSLQRLPLELASGNVLTHKLDFTDPASAASGIAPGSTAYIQAWYRDPAAGGAGFNLSHGLTVTLCP